MALNLLNEKIIKENINYVGTFSPIKIDILESVPSTNDYLKERWVNNSNEVSICLAEYQSAGKGRLGRSWHSPFAANIYLSCQWCVSKDISQLNGLSLVIALAIVSALKEVNLTDQLTIKWPNDILWKQEKLGGVLIEINKIRQDLQIIIGIGLNVNMSVDEAENKIDQAWTSLRKITGQDHDRNKIAGVLISHILFNLEKFNKSGFTAFMEEWKNDDGLYGKRISINSHKNSIHGTAVGVNEQGHLLLQNECGDITAYSAGEATLHSLLS